MGRHQILLCFLFLLRSSSLPFASRLCPPDQRDALLRLKDSFLLDRMASYYSCEDDASYPKTNSWNKSVDCCSWDGVTCDIVTGKVVGLDLACGWLHGALHSNSSLFLLGHLRSLNLFGNNFAGSSISPNLSAFAELTHLNLSTSHFSGSVPGEISRLSKLVSLDLSISDMSSYSYLRLENPVFTMLVQNLTALEKLVLDQVDMPMVSPKYFANFSSSLTYLSASGCSLGGILFPDIVLQLPSLTHLDISLNDYVSGILPQSNWTVPLEYLSLRLTNISGEIPDSIGSLSRLTVLDVSGCRLTGHIPSSTWNLKKLQALYLDRNYLSGVVEFENFAKFKDLRALTVSQELNLIYDAPKYTFPALEVLRLPSCNLTKFPYFLSSLKRLTDLDLSSNGISGEIPRWFWGVSQDTLEHLDLSSNLLEGGIPQLHWKRLSSISLENNSFQGPLPIPPPSTSFFDASRNGFTGEVPSSICLLSSLWMLDLSNNNLSGNMPSCFGNITDLQHLVLSNNKLQGPLMRSLVKFHGRNNPTVLGLSSPALRILSVSNNNFIGWWPVELFSNTSLVILDLSNNEFEGPIPLPSPVTFYYSTANNKLTGKIPSSICNATRLTIVDLSNNALTGSLPRCLTNFSTSLSVLNLRMNYLEGTIPLSFSSGNSLMTLDLSRNLIEGTLPRSLVECRNLEVLDLSDNQMKDTFPRWLGTLPELKVLVLRSNNLKDMLDIPLEAHLFPKLRILDLSNNNFSGPLPSNLITNLKGMMIGKNGQVKSLYMTRSFGRIP